MMNREELIYLAPYVLSLIALAGILLYALGNRYLRGAGTFAWLISGQFLTTLGSLFELLSPRLETKLFWDTFQWLTTTFLVILPFVIFAVQVSEYKLRSPSFTWGAILTFLGIFIIFLLTDNIHNLFYQNPRLTTDTPFPALTYDFTLPIYIYLLVYGYGANLYGIILLIARAFQARSILRWQYLILAAGFLIPLIYSFLTLANIPVTPQYNIMPLAFAVGSLMAAWGLFHYGIFDIAPLAREQVIEDLADPVFVLDPRNRIVDLNKAALTLVGGQRSGVVGQTLNVAFAKWPSLIEALNNPLVQRKEVSNISNDRTFFFDISISPILGRKREMIGRICVVRDITKLKTLESNYQALSQELEQRIKKNTEELHTTAERYRTIVENYSDFIVRWKPDGTRTFVNEPYCNYWDINYEQALAKNFLFHSAGEDRPDIEEKIARMNSGVTDVELEIHQVIRPDGSIAWQEWIDTAIRDEWGKLTEIQSVGRDITERKRAEENLNS